jgi:hypothetical protein
MSQSKMMEQMKAGGMGGLGGGMPGMGEMDEGDDESGDEEDGDEAAVEGKGKGKAEDVSVSLIAQRLLEIEGSSLCYSSRTLNR